MKILMINQPICNRGDESAHKALVRAICKALPKVEIKVLFVGNRIEYISPFDVNLPNVSYINIPALKGYNYIEKFSMVHNLPFLLNMHPTTRRVKQEYLKADVVLCEPGGICMGGFQNWGHLFMLSNAMYLNKPLAYYGRSIGPFPVETESNRLFKKLSYKMLHYFSFLSIRDKKSEKLAQEIGVDFVSTVDSAFLDSPHVPIPNEISNEIGDSKYLVFVPNSLTWHYAFKHIADDSILDFYCRMVDILLSKYPHHKIVMLPQLYGNGQRCDINYFRKIVNRKRDAHLVVVDDIYSSDIQQTVISKAELVVGARYHSIVFAINNNIPFISLSYEHKMAGLLDTLGVKQGLLDITHAFETNQKIDECLMAFTNMLDKSERFDGVQTKAKGIAKECFMKFESFLHSYSK